MRSSAIISNILQKPIGCFPLILPLEIFDLILNKHWFDILFEFQFEKAWFSCTFSKIFCFVKKAKINQNSLNVKFDESELKTPFFGLFWTEIWTFFVVFLPTQRPNLSCRTRYLVENASIPIVEMPEINSAKVMKKPEWIQKCHFEAFWAYFEQYYYYLLWKIYRFTSFRCKKSCFWQIM